MIFLVVVVNIFPFSFSLQLTRTFMAMTSSSLFCFNCYNFYTVCFTDLDKGSEKMIIFGQF
jgi:hypothetical protein